MGGKKKRAYISNLCRALLFFRARHTKKRLPSTLAAESKQGRYETAARHSACEQPALLSVEVKRLQNGREKVQEFFFFPTECVALLSYGSDSPTPS